MLIDQLRSSGQRPRFHGNGFVQLYLGPETRLHVWSSRLPRISGHNAAIHDHVYDMQSTILLGVLTQVTYEIVEQPHHMTESDPVDVWRLGTEARRSGAPEFDHIGRGLVRETGRLCIAQDCTYSQARDVLHDSEPSTEIVATMFERRPRPDDLESPRILSPAGEQPMNAFAPHTQPDQDTLWRVLDMACQLMCSESRARLREQIALQRS